MAAPARDPDSVLDPAELVFADGTALAVRVEAVEQVPAALGRLGLSAVRPTLVLVGGAGGLKARQRERLRPYTDALAAVVAEAGGAIVDGGTDSGVMRLMGEAVARAAAPFPLVGVAAAGTVALPGGVAVTGTAPLEPHHSHFVLVPGHEWGDESEWLSLVAGVLAGPFPSVTVLVNGGVTAWRDVEASVAASRPVVLLTGSGRAADDIALALTGTGSGDRADRLAASGLVEAVSLDAGVAGMAEVVRARLAGRSM